MKRVKNFTPLQTSTAGIQRGQPEDQRILLNRSQHFGRREAVALAQPRHNGIEK